MTYIHIYINHSVNHSIFVLTDYLCLAFGLVNWWWIIWFSLFLVLLPAYNTQIKMTLPRQQFFCFVFGLYGIWCLEKDCACYWVHYGVVDMVWERCKWYIFSINICVCVKQMYALWHLRNISRKVWVLNTSQFTRRPAFHKCLSFFKCVFMLCCNWWGKGWRLWPSCGILHCWLALGGKTAI